MEKSFTISSNADGLPLHGLVVEPNGEKKASCKFCTVCASIKNAIAR